MNIKSRDVQHLWNKTHKHISYAEIDSTILREFKGTHPAAIKDWLPEISAPFEADPAYKLSFRDKRQRVKMLIEKITGIDMSKKYHKLVT
jgi:hypothetical protein